MSLFSSRLQCERVNLLAVQLTCHWMPRRHGNMKSAKQQQQSELQSKLIMGGLCAGLLVFLAVVWTLSNSERLVST